MTQGITIYTLFNKNNGKYFRVIDTPGFKDVEGVEKDEAILHQLESLFGKKLDNQDMRKIEKFNLELPKEQITELDYVCICMPAENMRLTGDMSYVLSRFMSLFAVNI